MWIAFHEMSVILLKRCKTRPCTDFWLGADPHRSGVENILDFWLKINECLHLSLFSGNCFVTLSKLISAENHFPELFRNIFWSRKDSCMSHAIRSHILHPQQRQSMSDQRLKCIYKKIRGNSFYLFIIICFILIGWRTEHILINKSLHNYIYLL